MREILFKAKRLDNGEWIEGNYIGKHDPILDVEYSFIVAQAKGESFVTWYKVDPETVCQYTGINDKNGVKIFEDDLLEYCGDCYVVAFFNGNFCCPEFYELQTQFPWNMAPESTDEVEVVGNIHDEVEK